jgi:APA family basic amino acid/polyamine antiporter
VLRWRAPQWPRPYRCWGYPVTPLAFLALEGWMVVHTLQQKPHAGRWSLVTIAVGLLVASVVWFAAGCPADRSDSPD